MMVRIVPVSMPPTNARVVYGISIVSKGHLHYTMGCLDHGPDLGRDIDHLDLILGSGQERDDVAQAV